MLSITNDLDVPILVERRTLGGVFLISAEIVPTNTKHKLKSGIGTYTLSFSIPCRGTPEKVRFTEKLKLVPIIWCTECLYRADVADMVNSHKRDLFEEKNEKSEVKKSQKPEKNHSGKSQRKIEKPEVKASGGVRRGGVKTRKKNAPVVNRRRRIKH